MTRSKSRFKLFFPRRDRTAAMPFIMLKALIDMVSIGLIIPVLPALVGSLTGSQVDQAFWYAVVTFAFSLANFFGSPVLVRPPHWLWQFSTSAANAARGRSRRRPERSR